MDVFDPLRFLSFPQFVWSSGVTLLLKTASPSVFWARDGKREGVEKATGNSTLAEGTWCVCVRVRILTHILSAHLQSPRQHLATSPFYPHKFSRGNQRPEWLLSSATSPHFSHSQWHKFHPPFLCLPGADETLNGGLMKSQGLSCGLITQASSAWGGPPFSAACWREGAQSLIAGPQDKQVNRKRGAGWESEYRAKDEQHKEEREDMF